MILTKKLSLLLPVILKYLTPTKATRILRHDDKMDVQKRIYSAFFSNGDLSPTHNLLCDFYKAEPSHYSCFYKVSDKTFFDKNFQTDPKNLQKKGKEIFCSMLSQQLGDTFDINKIVSNEDKDEIYNYLYKSILPQISNVLIINNKDADIYIKNNCEGKKPDNWAKITVEKHNIKRVGILLAALITSYNFERGITCVFSENEFEDLIKTIDMRKGVSIKNLYTIDAKPCQRSSVSENYPNKNTIEKRVILININYRIQQTLINGIFNLIIENFTKSTNIKMLYKTMVEPYINTVYKFYYKNQSKFSFINFISSIEAEYKKFVETEKTKSDKFEYEMEWKKNKLTHLYSIYNKHDISIVKVLLYIQLFINSISSKYNIVEYVYATSEYDRFKQCLYFGYTCKNARKPHERYTDVFNRNMMKMEDILTLNDVFTSIAKKIKHSTAELEEGTKEAMYYWSNYNVAEPDKTIKEKNWRILNSFLDFKLGLDSIVNLFTQYCYMNNSRESTFNFMTENEKLNMKLEAEQKLVRYAQAQEESYKAYFKYRQNSRHTSTEEPYTFKKANYDNK